MVFAIKIMVLLTLSGNLALAQNYEFELPEKKNEEELINLYREAKVKAVRIITFKTLADAQANANGVLKEVQAINVNGFPARRMVHLLDDKEVELEMTYFFNDVGYLAAFYLYEKGKQISAQKLYYTADNKLQSTVSINKDYKVDSTLNNRMVEWIDGKKITTSRLDIPGSILDGLRSKIVEEFNKYRNQYIITQLSDGEYVYRKVIYDLDTSNNIVKKTFVKSDDDIGSYVHQYDKNLNVCTRAYSKDDTLIKTIKREYNSKQLLVRVIDIDSKRNVMIVEDYQYEFF